MSKDRNEEIEEYYFEHFRQDYRLPSGKIRRGAGAGPDYVLCGEKKIGIEITQLYETKGSDPQSAQAQAKLRRQIITQAEEEFRKNTGEAIRLTLGFREDKPIKAGRELQEKLVELAARLRALPNGVVPAGLFEDIAELWYVYVDRRPTDQAEDGKMERTFYDDVTKRSYRYLDNPRSAWFDLGSGRGPDKMAMKPLREILKEKELKSQKYEQCDAYWLLVVVNYADPAQDHEIRIDYEPVSTGVFDKVLLYRTHVGHVIEFPTTKTASNLAEHKGTE